MDRLLTLEQVCEVVPLGRRTIRRWSVAGQFPRPRRCGRLVLWLESEVVAWMRSLEQAELVGGEA